MSGILAPKPVSSFAHFNFDDHLMKAIRKAGYTQPSPIQAQVGYVHIYYRYRYIDSISQSSIQAQVGHKYVGII